MKKTALITGITGQDGAYLADFLLSKNYKIIGCYRRSSTPNFWRLSDLNILHNSNLILQDLDITDANNILRVLEKFQPLEIYNLAAQSFVTSSFLNPLATSNVNSLGTLNILEAIRIFNKKIRFYQASTSEMFGKIQDEVQNEETPFYPRSPYAVSKLYAHWMTINYREGYDIFGSCGILFNHESPLRGEEFVTKKITLAVARIKNSMQDTLFLGNLNAKRDWGFAKDYVVGMWKMLQIEKPDTFILATGKNETIRNFARMAFSAAGMEIEFVGSYENETGIDKKTGKTLLKVDKSLYRPSEVEVLLGNPEKAKKELGWEATTNLEELAEIMVNYDLKKLKS